MFKRVLFGCTVVICAAGVAGAQTKIDPNTPPPVKMGLWETHVTSQVKGIELPPDVIERLKQMGRPLPGEAHTTVTRGCLTPEEWRQELEEMNKPTNTDCTVTRNTDNVSSISFDVSCKTEEGTVTGHWEMHILDDEHAHGSGHMKSDQTGPNGQSFTADSTVDTRWISADCGDVRPGKAKVMEQ